MLTKALFNFTRREPAAYFIDTKPNWKKENILAELTKPKVLGAAGADGFSPLKVIVTASAVSGG